MELIVGKKFINKIYELREVVIITKITTMEMWGQHSKEAVKIIHYVSTKNWHENKNIFDLDFNQVLSSHHYFTDKTTEYNFISKYIDIETIREDKLNILLNIN